MDGLLSKFCRPLLRALVHFRIMSPTDPYYHDSPYPYALAVLTTDGRHEAELKAEQFFELVVPDRRSQNYHISQITIWKKSETLLHEFLIVYLSGSDGDTTYVLKFERHRPRDIDGDRTRPIPNDPSTHSSEASGFYRYTATHRITILPYSDLSKHLARYEAYDVIDCKYLRPSSPTSAPGPSRISSTPDGDAVTHEHEVVTQTPASRLDLQQFARLATCVIAEFPKYSLAKGSCYWLAGATVQAVQQVLELPSMSTNRVPQRKHAGAGQVMAAGIIIPYDFSHVSKQEINNIVEAYKALPSPEVVTLPSEVLLRKVTDLTKLAEMEAKVGRLNNDLNNERTRANKAEKRLNEVEVQLARAIAAGFVPAPTAE